MTSWNDKIVLADSANEWRAAVVEEFHTERALLHLTDNGKELFDALVDDVTPPRVVVIGHELSGQGGLDTLYLAHKEKLARLQQARPRQKIWLITDGLADVELLQLFSNRGVTGFLRRTDPVEAVVSNVLASYYAENRAHPRHPVKIDVVVEMRGSSAKGIIDDLSISGAQVVISSKKLSATTPAIGDSCKVRFEVHDLQFDCTAEIRRITPKKSLFGDRLIVGLRFVDLGSEREAALKQTLERETLERERRDDLINLSRPIF